MPTTHLDPIQAGAQITRDNFHWGMTLGSATGPITLGFRQSATTNNSTTEKNTFSQFTAQEIAAVETIIHEWAALANITFTEVNPSSYTNSATILFANYNSTSDGAQAYSYFPSSNNQNSASAQGDVWLNTAYESTTSLPFGGYDFLTLLHEIGHALGLEHPGGYNAGPGQTITYANSAQYVEDTRQYTVMSYFAASNTGANHAYNGHTVYASTPLLDDITAIQRLYGANISHATGNTVYGFNSNADSAYHISSSTQQVVYCIWDAGGGDTLDCSGYSTNQLIDLIPGTFSNVGALTMNVSIALGTIIEAAIGGSGNDTFYGNSANNTIDGRGGSDTVIFTGAHNQYYITLASDGSIQLADLRAGSPDGSDTLVNIEFLQFSDGIYPWAVLLATNTPPVATINDHSLQTNQWAQVSNWVSYSDVDGNAATQYQFWDSGTSDSSGYFWTPSNAHWAANTAITVAGSDLSSVWLRGGTVGGSEAMWVRAFDGTDWSAWDSFNFTTQPNAPPVATINDHSLQTNQWAQVSNWLSYSDADGNAATQYQFWDSGTSDNSGYFWTPSNAHWAANTAITVAASDLSNVWIRGGMVGGSETIWVSAFDGTNWSAWGSFHLTTLV